LHLLQTLNVHTFDPDTSLQQRAAMRGAVLSTLRRHGVPPHTCDCAVEIDPATKSRMESVYAGYVDRVVTASGHVAGDVADVTGAVPGRHAVHSRFPGPDSAAACLAFLWNMVGDARAETQELDEAGTFWHTRADAYSEARDHWLEQAENWQKVAEGFETARDHWHEQAQNWQKVAEEFETARDHWHEQAQNWQKVAEDQQ
jgi:hypothetical protein